MIYGEVIILDNSQELLKEISGDNTEKYKKVGAVKNYKIKNNEIHIELEYKKIIIYFLSADIFRVSMKDRDEIRKITTTAAVIDHDLYYTQFNIKDFDQKININTENISLVINKNNFALQVYNQKNNLIHSDYIEHALGWKKKKIRAWKKLNADDRFYGLGEKTGWLDKKGRKYEMWNHDTFAPHVSDTDPLYQSIPFLIGFNRGIASGIYFDNSYRSYFDLGSEGQDYYSFWADGGKMDYYFFNGPSIKDVISRYSKITGKMPLPPKWSLGYHQSRYSYYPEEEVKELVNNFRKREIPCDAVHFDIHYMDQFKIYTWDEERFPDPKNMLDDLNQKGIKPVTIIDPGIKKDPEYELYQQGIENDYFCKYLDGKTFIDEVWPGDCAFPDFTQKKVRKWWASLQKDFVKLGVKGIWNDMNEPAVFNDTDTMDLDVMHQNDGDPGTHKRFHNLYGLLENKAAYKGLKENLNNERPFLLTRAGFAGIQRYSAVWTGDNRSFWEHIKLAVPMLMNIGMSGIAFCGTDVGGFTGNSSGELLTRWTQLGAFSPFFRNHCEVRAIAQEPWAFGKNHENIIKKYIELRYRLITHIYNLFYKSSKIGIPVMRPLVMEYPDDKETYNLSDQFMFGDSLMIAPIYEPDKNKRMVYLPEGEWIDFWSEKTYQGGNYKIIDAPLDKMPIFVKMGSIIPLNGKLNYIGEKKIDNLELNIYLSSKTNSNSYILYDDDGLSYNYLQEEYNLTEFKYQYEEKSIEFDILKIKENYKQKFKKFEFKFHNLNKAPKEILINGNELREFDYYNNRLEFAVPATQNKLKVKLN